MSLAPRSPFDRLRVSGNCCAKRRGRAFESLARCSAGTSRPHAVHIERCWRHRLHCPEREIPPPRAPRHAARDNVVRAKGRDIGAHDGQGVPEIFRVGKSPALPVARGWRYGPTSIAWDRGQGRVRGSSAGPQKVTRGAGNVGLIAF
jgi:hypothetical protein